MKKLDFSLPELSEISWVSPEARKTWGHQLKTAALQSAERSILAVSEKLVAAALIFSPPFNIPKLMRLASSYGLKTQVIPDTECIPDWYCQGTSNTGVVLAVSCETGLEKLKHALQAGDDKKLLDALGWPSCCQDAQLNSEYNDPAWRMALSSDRSSNALPWHSFLRRLGIYLAPHFSCSEGCEKSQAISRFLTGDGELDAIIAWPLSWSGLHGMAQVFTPLFKFVYNTDATSGCVDYQIHSDAVPVDIAIGVMHPYKQPKRRALSKTKGFQLGIENVLEDPMPPLTKIVNVEQFETLPEFPAVLSGLSGTWPALERWTLDFLLERFADQTITLKKDAKQREVRLGEFIHELKASEAGDGWYLTDFGFEYYAPDMLDDYQLPASLDSWHYLLPEKARPGLRSLYLGGKGSGVLLHVDILQTSAFNTLIFGEKHWFFCPPESFYEWLMNEPDLFSYAKRKDLMQKGLKIYEYIQKPGETLYIPHGWWHQTRNHDVTLSLTGNIVNADNAEDVRQASLDAPVPILKEIGAELIKAISLATKIDRQSKRK